MNSLEWWCGVGLICGAAMLRPAVGDAQNGGAEEPAKSAQSHPAQNGDSGIVGDSSAEEPDEPLAPVTEEAKKRSGPENAWAMIDAAVKHTKPQLRIDALTAVGTLGGFARAEEMAKAAIGDSDRDVRLAAAVAMGTMKDRRLIPSLRSALDDKAPEVSYAAAISLWKMHDRSGEAILYGVLAGERKAAPGFIDAEMHQANKDLHSPSTLALLGAEQGAYALLGPFGIGLDAAKMMMKGSSANSARVLTANLLADDQTSTTKRQFLEALRDKNYFVRSASARALGNYRGSDVATALLQAFPDKKPSVRLMAAASYIRVSGHGNRPPGKTQQKSAPPVPR